MNPAVFEIAKAILVINLSRYFFFALPAFALVYVLKRKAWSYRKIQAAFPKPTDYGREIFYSLLTILIFVGVGLIVFATPLRHYNLRYETIEEYGWPYWGLSVILMIFLHDTYFYWAHRLMHHPKLFRYFHSLHHKSTNPSPWAAYAFQPTEAVIEASIIFPIVFLIPFHKTALLAFLFFMMAYNVYGHLGFELFPKRFNRHPIGRWLNTSVNHNQHHKWFTGNYGLYFLFWDRWLGTIREDYDEAYQAVDGKRSTIELP